MTAPKGACRWQLIRNRSYMRCTTHDRYVPAGTRQCPDGLELGWDATTEIPDPPRIEIFKDWFYGGLWLLLVILLLAIVVVAGVNIVRAVFG